MHAVGIFQNMGFFSDEFDNPSDIISCVELFLMNILFSEYFKRFFLNVKGGEKASANYFFTKYACSAKIYH